MKVIIKAEDVDDYPYEVRAMEQLGEPRLRHFRPQAIKTSTTNTQRQLPQGVLIKQ